MVIARIPLLEIALPISFTITFYGDNAISRCVTIPP